jgi:hypothetical protein
MPGASHSIEAPAGIQPPQRGTRGRGSRGGEPVLDDVRPVEAEPAR